MKSELKRDLGPFDSTAIVAGSMIGSGIFIVSSDMSRILGSPFWLLIAWLLTGIITLAAALSYGELASMFPRAGGQYVYLKEAFGKKIAFLYGWTLFTVIQTGTIAAVSVAFAKFAGVLFPWISSANWILRLAAFKEYNIGLNTENLIAITIIVFLTWVNTKGISLGKLIQNVFTVTKIVSLIGLIIIGITLGKNISAININLSDFFNASWSHINEGLVTIEPISGLKIAIALGVAMVGSLFSSDAWNNITFTAGEVINPKKNVPLSLALGTTIVISIYLLVNITYLLILPLQGDINEVSAFTKGIQFAANDRVATAALETIFGNNGAVIMALLIMISTFGCANGIILSGARAYYAMAKDNLFFKLAGTTNKNMVPAYALYMQGIWTCILCLSGAYGNLLDYVIFAVLIFYVLTIIGLFVLRKQHPNLERPYKAFGYPLVPMFYILCATLIAIDILLFKPHYTWPGLFIVLLGVPIYYFWQKVPLTKTK